MSRRKSIRFADSSFAIPGAVLLAIALLAGVPGCGGDGAAAGESTTTAKSSTLDGEGDEEARQRAAQGDEDARRQAALDRLYARQEAACDQVGDAVFACAVEDARANMSQEELAKLDPDALRPRHKAEFMRDCMRNDMSLRQVKVFEGCLQDTTCAVFVPCLDPAQPER